MKFFIPAAKDDKQAERVYESISKFVGGSIADKRIWKLKWVHNGMDMEAEIDQTLPSYFQTGQEKVIAILDCGSFHSVCTCNRGVARGEPIRAGKGHSTCATYFDE